MRVLGIIQARVSSTRLPGKVLLPILGEPMLGRQIERVRRAETLDGLLVATSTDPSDDALEALCASVGVPCARGSLDDVLDRFVQAARPTGAEHVVRLTGDCPLIDPAIIDRVVRTHIEGGFDYTSNIDPPTFPDGLDVEVVRAAVLEEAWREATMASEREHVTLWVRDNAERFLIGRIADETDRSAMRWTVDEPADYEFVSKVYERLCPEDPAFGEASVLALLEREPALARINAGFARNEGLAKSYREEALSAGTETEG